MNYIESVQAAIDFIEEHMEDKVELEEVAKVASMSLPHLYRMFYSLTGHPVKDYMRKRIISIASEHLKNSNNTVLDIALACGFESQASFSKSFKKIVGVTPKVYKESDIYYCFEYINLFEKVNYLEGRDLFDRYPDVKVLRLKDMTVFSYKHKANCIEGIEKDAFNIVQSLIQKSHMNNKKIRYFGRNIDSEYHGNSEYSTEVFAYEMLVPVEESIYDSIEGMEIKNIQGGLYAVGSISAECEQNIISLWNRLYSEWLPKSQFTEGAHTYLEEYITFNKKLVRMKLYLPIERQLKPEMAKVEEVEPFWVAYSKSYGESAQADADNTLSKWLETDLPIDFANCQLYLSYNYGNENDRENWCEYGITTLSRLDSISDSTIDKKMLGGGLFATIETKSYGSLMGVLEIIHRWIVSEEKYIIDDSRQWFALYHTSINKEITVRCYIPIIERSKWYE
ncbi:AraC family transcriptional regulator [Ornithinibacillus bavariensis]|uniref:HTH araC/xylS-type domain-containing protein n=1 Tax=Ornithinibacillus bavariensis TaxID=545502 RepID=A0A919XCD9_9BACI|nr:AraC family transcriptional regulator [Ornithinibacillus bavariensis]GIO27978.1 hypothetical protein J43TS3_25890 [Ornithinibacillus bavariensis]